MPHAHPRHAALVLTAVVGLSACGTAAVPPVTPSAVLRPIVGSPGGQIVLTAVGAQRIGVQTALTRSVPAPPAPVFKKGAGSATRAGSAPAVRPGPALTRAEAVAPAKVLTTAGGPAVIIPYASVIYAPDGSTFAFTSSSPLVFTEVPVTIDHIDGGLAYLTNGPRAGTKVVTVGAEELFGVQTGVLPQT